MAPSVAFQPVLRRAFITPEGVDLQLELGTASSRAGAFLLDVLMMLAVLLSMTLALVYIAAASSSQSLMILWLLGAFVLRNGWFSLFEMGSRGATPGKRLMRLRVIARDGARLTGAAVIARNAMREIEVFLPLSFLVQQVGVGTANTFLVVFSLLWSGIFLIFPLLNRDRLRLGDLVAGTWVVRTDKVALSEDLVGSTPRQRRSFPEAALDLYGVYELQKLEAVLRHEEPDAIVAVANAIRTKAGIAPDGDDYGFLADYYAALCARLEAGLLVGQRRESKFVPAHGLKSR